MTPATARARLRTPVRTLFRRLIAVLAGLTLLSGGTPAVAEPVAADPSVAAAPSRDRARMNQRVFDRVWSEVQREYYDPALHGIDWRAARAAFRPGALAARDDHAGAAPPAAVRRQDRMRERRAVMGLTLFPQDDGRYRIEHVRAGSAAEAAGIGPGWTLELIDGQGWGPEVDVVADRPLTLDLTDDPGQARTVRLTPRLMNPTPAFTVDRTRPGVVVLRIEGFEAGLGRWLGAQIAALHADEAVLLDLRGNPGGLLIEADAVLSCFLPREQVWATRTARSGRAAR